jgi:hypothetical protein
MNPDPIKPNVGQESVWDYPRPPRLEPCAKRIRVVFALTEYSKPVIRPPTTYRHRMF